MDVKRKKLGETMTQGTLRLVVITNGHVTTSICQRLLVHIVLFFEEFLETVAFRKPENDLSPHVEQQTVVSIKRSVTEVRRSQSKLQALSFVLSSLEQHFSLVAFKWLILLMASVY